MLDPQCLPATLWQICCQPFPRAPADIPVRPIRSEMGDSAPLSSNIKVQEEEISHKVLENQNVVEHMDSEPANSVVIEQENKTALAESVASDCGKEWAGDNAREEEAPEESFCGEGEGLDAGDAGDTGDGAEDGESNEDENMDPQPDSRAIEEEDDSGDDDESDSSDGEDQHRVENHEEDSSDDDDEDELPDKSGMEMDQSPDDRHLEMTSSKICRIFSLHSLL